jgi:hypothetical protein
MLSWHYSYSGPIKIRITYFNSWCYICLILSTEEWSYHNEYKLKYINLYHCFLNTVIGGYENLMLFLNNFSFISWLLYNNVAGGWYYEKIFSTNLVIRGRDYVNRQRQYFSILPYDMNTTTYWCVSVCSLPWVLQFCPPIKLIMM